MTDVTMTATFPAAVLAGLLSFASPCVLPLVLPYLSYLAGETLDEILDRSRTEVNRRALTAAFAFVLGFSTVFVLMGATASAFGQMLRQHVETLSLIAGVAIILMGLHFLGAFRFPWMHREARFRVPKPAGLWGAYIMGLAFAFGWTPCIGPVLAAILSVAATQESAARGALLLTAYAAGLGVPFVLAAFAMRPFVEVLRHLRTRFSLVERIAGVLLVLTGVAFLTGMLTDLSFWLLETFPALQRLG